MENPFLILNQIIERLAAIEAILKALAKPSLKKEDDQLVTRKDAAKILGVSEPTCLAWTKDGILQGYRIGPRNVRYKRSDVENVLIQLKKK